MGRSSGNLAMVGGCPQVVPNPSHHNAGRGCISEILLSMAQVTNGIIESKGLDVCYDKFILPVI